MRGINLFIILATCLVVTSVKGSLEAEPLNCSVSAEAAILINADSGVVLFEKNASSQYFPASITKIATALYCLKKKPENLDQLVIADQEAIGSITPSAKRKSNYKKPAYWIETGSNHIGIKRGEELPLIDLLHAMLIASANDASNIVAQYVGGGSIDSCMRDLNAYLSTLGCRETQFLNPHGLHHPDHKTSARDMALIAREAMQIPIFAEIVAKKNYVCPKTNKQPSRPISQTNLLLKKGPYFYEKAIGIKTGYCLDAGATLVAAAENEGRTLIAVVLGCSDRKSACQDVITLFNAAFEEKRIKKCILQKGLQKYHLILEGASLPVQTYLSEDVEMSYFPSEEQSVKVVLQWKEGLKPPLAKDMEVGNISFYTAQGALIKESPLLSYSKVNQKLWYSLLEVFKSFNTYSFVARGTFVVGSVCTVFGLVWWLKRRKKR